MGHSHGKFSATPVGVEVKKNWVDADDVGWQQLALAKPILEREDKLL